jgi:hypothetical protein
MVVARLRFGVAFYTRKPTALIGSCFILRWMNVLPSFTRLRYAFPAPKSHAFAGSSGFYGNVEAASASFLNFEF